MAVAPRPTVHVQVAHGIDIKSLTAILEKAIAPTGCRTCGLGGFDISFVVDPAPDFAIQKSLAGAHGFEGATVSFG